MPKLLLLACLACSSPDTRILTAWPFDQRTDGILHTFRFEPDGSGLHRQLGPEPDLLAPFHWTLEGNRLCMTYLNRRENCGEVRLRERDGHGEIEWLSSGARWVSRWPKEMR